MLSPPPEYVLKAAEAAIQARRREKGGRRAGHEIENCEGRDSGDTLVESVNDKVRKAGRSSVFSASSIWDGTIRRTVSSSKEIEGYEDSLTALLAPSEVENPRSSIRIRIWETDSIIDLLQPSSAPAFKTSFDNSAPEHMYISSTYVEADPSLGRRLVVAWKNASALTRKLFSAAVSTRGGDDKESEEPSESDCATPCEFEIIHVPMTNRQDF